MVKLSESDKKEIVEFLRQKGIIVEERFWGAIEIKCEDDKLVIIKKTTSIK